MPTRWPDWPKSGLRLQVIRDRLTAPPGRAMVRVIQASLRQHRVTVRADGRVLARDQAFGTVSSYRDLAPGTWTVRAANPSEFAATRIRMAADGIYTVVVLDDPGNLAVAVLTDAAGSSLVPEGAADTGFGGTAAKPGGSPLPWLITMAAGLMLILTGTMWLRRAAVRVPGPGRAPEPAACGGAERADRRIAARRSASTPRASSPPTAWAPTSAT
jgi:Domain of unknown function (DUF4397)